MQKIRIAVPKSGCLKTKMKNGATQSILFEIFNQVARFSDQNFANNNIRTGFANSEGWILNIPRGIQRSDPLVSNPKISTAKSVNKINIYNGLIRFFID